MSVLSALIKNNRINVFIAVTVAVFANLIQMIYIVFIGKLVNKIEGRDNISLFFVAVLVVFMLTSVGFIYLKNFYGRLAAEKMAHTLRMGFVRKLLEKQAVTEKKAVGTVMSKVQNELSRADEYMANTLFEITNMLLTCILVFFFLMFQNIVLTLVIFIPTILILIYVKWSSRCLSGIVSSTLNEKEKMNRVSYSLVSAFPAVKIYNGDKMCTKVYEKALDNWGKCEAEMEKKNALYNSFSGILSRVPLLLLLTAGGYMVLKGYIMLGTLIVFLNMHSNLTQTIMNLPSWISGFKVFTTNLDKLKDSLLLNQIDKRRGIR